MILILCSIEYLEPEEKQIFMMNCVALQAREENEDGQSK